ncbi:LysR family transcriptional regulator [Mesorhizobium sp. M1403]|uniref:helix-turn-helix domain-containing protein n=1 Tax=Mesorhizobium sp. M1403 TaxID=2957097 RepID=UPI00333C1D3C
MNIAILIGNGAGRNLLFCQGRDNNYSCRRIIVGFHQADNELSVNQATVSTPSDSEPHILMLENRLDTQLFTRRNQKV